MHEREKPLHVAPGSAPDSQREGTDHELDLHAPPRSALHASPLDVPPLASETLGGKRLPLLIMGTATVLAAGIVATAVVVRGARSNAAEPTLSRAETDDLEQPVTVAPVARNDLATMTVPSSAPAHTARTQTAPGSDLASAKTAVPTTSAHTISSPASGASASPPIGTTGASENRRESRERAAARAEVRRGARERGEQASARPSARARDTSPRLNPWLQPKRGDRFPRSQYRPSRAQVIAAMRRVTPAVYACFDRGRGFAMVRISVSGKNGRVKSARVLGQTGDHVPCITRAVRRAQFPKFLKPTLAIDYPFKR